MSAPTVTPAEPLHADEVPVAHYRSISLAAVLAVILGMLSAAVLASPIFSPIVVAAALVAVFALRQIAAAKDQLIGRRAAIVGLCLAGLFFGWGLTRYFTRQQALEEHARHGADIFLRLIADGQLREAYQFRRPPSSRILSPTALKEHYATNKEAADELATFTADAVILELTTLKDQAHVRYEGVARAARYGMMDRLTLRYTYAKESAPGGRQPLWIHMMRQTDFTTQRPEWEIEAVSTMLLPSQQE